MNDSIIQDYSNGSSINTLYRKYKISPQFILEILRNASIKIRNRSESHRKHEINESYFEKIDSVDKAYFLGFLYADGYVSSTNNTISLSLSEVDKSILELFSSTVFGSRPLRKKIWRKSDKETLGYDLSVSNFKMKQDLIKLGCGCNKSFTLGFPTADQVPSILMSHFLRGYFDGDGSIMMKSRHGKEIGSHFSVVSSVDFINGMLNILKSKNLKMRIETPSHYSHPMLFLQTSRKDNICFLYYYLYKDCGVWFLPRKKTKFEECVSKIKNKPPAYYDKPATV